MGQHVEKEQQKSVLTINNIVGNITFILDYSDDLDAYKEIMNDFNQPEAKEWLKTYRDPNTQANLLHKIIFDIHNKTINGGVLSEQVMQLIAFFAIDLGLANQKTKDGFSPKDDALYYKENHLYSAMSVSLESALINNDENQILDALADLQKINFDKNSKTKDGKQYLILLAAKTVSFEIFKLLADYLNVTIINSSNESALSVAIKSGNKDLALGLFKYNFETPSLYVDKTAEYDALNNLIYYAAKIPGTEVLEQLLKRITGPKNCFDDHGNNILDLALLSFNKEAVMFLLDSGYTLNRDSVVTTIANGKIIPAIHLAAMLPDDEVLKRLVKLNNLDIFKTDEKGMNALHIAISHWNVPAVEWLLKQGLLLKLPKNEGFKYFDARDLLPNDRVVLTKNAQQKVDAIKMLIADALDMEADTDSESDSEDLSLMDMGTTSISTNSLSSMDIDVFKFVENNSLSSTDEDYFTCPEFDSDDAADTKTILNDLGGKIPKTVTDKENIQSDRNHTSVLMKVTRTKSMPSNMVLSSESDSDSSLDFNYN